MSHTIRNATPAELLTRLRKVEGQIRGVQHMIERGDRCTEVLTQIAAARAALGAVGLGLVDCELRRVVSDDEIDQRAAAASDLLVAIGLLTER